MGTMYFLSLLQGRLGQERVVPHSVVRPFASLVFLFIFIKAQLSGHKLAGGVGHCLLDCGGLSHP